MHSRSLSRRDILKGSALLGAGLGFAGALAQPPPSRKGLGVGLDLARPFLRIPPVVRPDGLVLRCAPGVVDLGVGQPARCLAYNGLLPGPTMLARRGETATIALRNDLPEETITHWHGMVVDTPNDGGPQLHVMPGETYNYQFPIIQRACLNFYHPHTHLRTGYQVNMGMAGGFIVRDAEEDALRLPSGRYEVPLVIRDASVDANGDLIYNAGSSGFVGDFSLVNGQRFPRLLVDRGFYRFRIVNGANARVFRLALSNGGTFSVIGNDGGLLERAVTLSEVVIANGERLDVLIDLSSVRLGDRVFLRCLDANWNLVEFFGTGQPGQLYQIPGTLSTVERLQGPATVTRLFSFDGMSRINGRRWEMGRIDFQVPLGVVERWRFETGGNAPHPVHVHGASFQVVSRSGGRGQVFPWEAGWKDTVLLLDRENVEVFVRFDGYRGEYVMHCHKLEHEDMGMMSSFVVV